MSKPMRGSASVAYALDASRQALIQAFNSPDARWTEWDIATPEEDKKPRQGGYLFKEMTITGRIAGVRIENHVPWCVVELCYRKKDATAPWELYNINVHTTAFSIRRTTGVAFEMPFKVYAATEEIWKAKHQSGYHRDGYLRSLPSMELIA